MALVERMPDLISENEPTVSVVIPCFNYGRYLQAAVASAMAQTLIPTEIIIVDDGSTDDSLDVANHIAEYHENVHVISQPHSGRGSISRNTGIEQATGEFICALDADDLIAPTYLEECVRSLRLAPETSIAYGVRQDFGASRVRHEGLPFTLNELSLSNRITGVQSVFRREAWSDVGGYAIDNFYADWDFWLSCARRGHFWTYAEHAVWYYRVHDKSQCYNGQSRDLLTKAQIVMRHRSLYAPEQIDWADRILNGTGEADTSNGALGKIPFFGTPMDYPALQGLRDHALLSLADELIDNPELLRTYCAKIRSDDQVSLIVAIEDGRSSIEEVQALVTGLGLSDEQTPDLVAVRYAETWQLARIASQASGLYSVRRPIRCLRKLPIYGVGSLDAGASPVSACMPLHYAAA